MSDVESRFQRLNNVLAMWDMSVVRHNGLFVIRRGKQPISPAVTFAEVERRIDAMMGSHATQS